MNIKNRKQQGFTIIEVLIVLAIAGLILLIVFLAVPALQRNSRNTQRRNDIASILGGVNEYATNNNGALPTADTQFEPNVKLGFYTVANVTLVTPVPASLPAVPAVDAAVVYTGARCSGNSPVGGAGRAVAVRFSVESSTGTPIEQCQEG